MKRKIEKSDFRFKFMGYGHYRVLYKSPVSLRTWTAVLSDMSLIDSVLHEEEPKKKDLELLKKTVKRESYLPQW